MHILTARWGPRCFFFRKPNSPKSAELFFGWPRRGGGQIIVVGGRWEPQLQPIFFFLFEGRGSFGCFFWYVFWWRESDEGRNFLKLLGCFKNPSRKRSVGVDGSFIQNVFVGIKKCISWSNPNAVKGQKLNDFWKSSMIHIECNCNSDVGNT